jgi:hypothetical protein
MSNYKQILDFGSNSEINNPLTYCMNINMNHKFLHGSSSNNYGQYSVHCQNFLSDYCSEKWDDFCQVASEDTNFIDSCGLTAGETLIKETAEKKYIVDVLGCKKIERPFDPNVAASPLISYWVSKEDESVIHTEDNNIGTSVYDINTSSIDNDIIISYLVEKPYIAPNVLIGLYKVIKQKNELSKISETILGKFYIKNSDVFNKL